MTVVAEPQPEDEDIIYDDEVVGIKHPTEVTRVPCNILLCRHFLHFTFKVSIVLEMMMFCDGCMFISISFSDAQSYRAGRLSWRN